MATLETGSVRAISSKSASRSNGLRMKEWAHPAGRGVALIKMIGIGGVCGRQDRDQPDAVQLRHLHIRHNQVRHVLGDLAQGHDPITGLLDRKARV